MSKTLRELLKEKKYQECNIKVGSKGGSSFWYCGKVLPYLTVPLINEEREKLLEQSKRTLKLVENRIKNLDKIYERIINENKGKHKNDYDKWLAKTIKKRENERKQLPKRKARVEYDIAIHLLDRPVLEVVEGISPDEKPCWIVYVKGEENGDYWTIKEYEKKNKRRLL